MSSTLRAAQRELNRRMVEKGSRSIGQKSPRSRGGASARQMHPYDRRGHLGKRSVYDLAIIGQWEFSERIAAAS
jgi:hypothetical protein